MVEASRAISISKAISPGMPPVFSSSAPQFDRRKTAIKGKIFTLTGDRTGDGEVNVDDLAWDYLAGDGDFRSEEVTKLRDEADMIITNPPFSLFREFLAWVVAADKQFVIIGNMNAITYKEVFPLIKENKIWLGNGFHAGNAYFFTHETDNYAEGVFNPETGLVKFRNVIWFTNLDHGRRHQPLPLMSMADNLKYSNHQQIRGKAAYDRYDNYDAIEVPFTAAIPADYDGVMGVPISFMDKYNPDQFEIIGMAEDNGKGFSGGIWDGKNPHCVVNGKNKFKRIFIKHRRASTG